MYGKEWKGIHKYMDEWLLEKLKVKLLSQGWWRSKCTVSWMAIGDNWGNDSTQLFKKKQPQKIILLGHKIEISFIKIQTYQKIVLSFTISSKVKQGFQHRYLSIFLSINQIMKMHLRNSFAKVDMRFDILLTKFSIPFVCSKWMHV